MLKFVRTVRIASAIGVSLGLSINGYAQSYDAYAHQSLGLQSELATERSTVAGVSLKIPFGMQARQRDIMSQPRLSFGVNFTDPAYGNSGARESYDFSFGYTFSGEQYLAFGGEPVPAGMIAAYLDEAEETSGGNTALYIVGGVLLAGGLLAVAANEFEDTIEDCFADLFNGSEGGCSD